LLNTNILKNLLDVGTAVATMNISKQQQVA